MENKKTFLFEDLGVINYPDAYTYQKELFDTLIHAKHAGEAIENRLLFCEHPSVYTLGKSGNRKNLLISDVQLQAIGASFYCIARGGDITYHGPGQLVGYLLFDLDSIGISIKDFVYNIEEMLILALKNYGIVATRLEKATGVWIDAHNPVKARKIAAIGMRIHNKISMHGFALNINTNLDYFGYIIPCGLTDKGVTSLQKELKSVMDMETVKKQVIGSFEKIFGIEARVLQVQKPQ